MLCTLTSLGGTILNTLSITTFPHLQVDSATYTSTIEHVNEHFDEAERLGCCNVLEGCLSCMTGFALHYCFKTHYERVSTLKIVSVLIQIPGNVVVFLGPHLPPPPPLAKAKSLNVAR